MKPILYVVPAIAWAAAIFALSGTSGERVTELQDEVVGRPIASFWIHFGEYAILAALLLLAAHGWRKAASRSTDLRAGHLIGLAVIAAATIYGVTDEFHQTFVSGRAAEAVDVGYDFLGAMSAVVGLRLFAAARSK